jgi:hypothetical protein
VRHADARGDYIQVKHSRVGRSISSGDLVGTDEQGSSLLGSLFVAWKAMKLNPARDKCILFTNRAAGESAGRSAAGVHRPSLFDFVAWLDGELKRVKTLRECRPPREWEAAWREWLAQLAPGTFAQRISFLRSFEGRANQEDLATLETSVLTALGDTFRIPSTKALPLFRALDSALRRWTTQVDELMRDRSAMSLEAANRENQK